MNRKEQLQDQLKALDLQADPLQEELNDLLAKEHEEVEKKIERCHAMKDKFTLEELIFAALSRCSCGAGLAYPKNTGPRGAWDCSDILLGRATPKSEGGSQEHSEVLPFAFYEVKSEEQPSANGATTRPSE